MRALKRIGVRLGVWAAAAIATTLIAGGQERAVNPGDPIPGITPTEFTEFRLGLEDFTEVETAEDGLGPAFNATSCAACHNVPAIGGTSLVLETRAAYRDAAGAFDALDTSGNTLMHLFSVPQHTCQPVIPADVNVVARRAPIPLFGAGLVEAIPDETLLALEDPLDRDRNGVIGRAAIVTDVATGERRVGRFGWKAQQATLLAFAGDAYRNEMGITNDLFPKEFAFGMSRGADQALRPAARSGGRARTDHAPARHRQLRGVHAVPRAARPRTVDALARTASASIRRDRLRAPAMCPRCTTGPSTNPVFNRKSVPLFSDLLLHDVGTGDGIRQAAAGPNGDQDAGAVGSPASAAVPARRQRVHHRGVDPAPPA